MVFDFGDGASSYATDAFVFVGRKTDSSNGFYVFFNNGQIYRMDTSRELIQVPESEYYVPLVTVNGRGADSDLYNPDAPNGTLFEGYNMLTAAFRAGFTADGKGSRLVLPLKDLDAGKPISISYIRGDYGAYWTIPANATESPSVTVNLDFPGRGNLKTGTLSSLSTVQTVCFRPGSPPAIQRSAEARTGLRPGCPPAGQTMISLSRRTGHKPGNRSYST